MKGNWTESVATLLEAFPFAGDAELPRPIDFHGQVPQATNIEGVD